MIILTTFEKALLSLEKALEQPKNEFIRDSVIQRFEYTYELAWKMLRRFLVADVGSEALAPLTRKNDQRGQSNLVYSSITTSQIFS